MSNFDNYVLAFFPTYIRFGPIQRLQSIRKIINFWYTFGWKWWVISFRDYLGLSDACSYDVIDRANRFGFQNFCSPACYNTYFGPKLWNSLTFPWLSWYLKFPWPICKIPWLFPDLEEKSNFPDFSDQWPPWKWWVGKTANQQFFKAGLKFKNSSAKNWTYNLSLHMTKPTNAQADLSLCWAHVIFCRAAAH